MALANRKLQVFLALGAAAFIATAVMVTQPSVAGEAPPVGCSASNVDYYFDTESDTMDIDKMNQLEWIPVSASDSAEIVGCVPQALADPTDDDARTLMEFGKGDPDVPLPIFAPDGTLYGYFVVYEGSVELSDALARGLIPERLVEDPPLPSDFDPDFIAVPIEP